MIVILIVTRVVSVQKNGKKRATREFTRSACTTRELRLVNGTTPHQSRLRSRDGTTRELRAANISDAYHTFRLATRDRAGRGLRIQYEHDALLLDKPTSQQYDDGGSQQC